MSGESGYSIEQSKSAQTTAANPSVNRTVPVHLEKLSWLMDQAIPVPGTRFSFGLDSIIGLIPGIGDAFGLVVSSWVVAGSVQAGARRRTVLRMLLNVGRDAVIGAIPLVGDLYDFGSKANVRNMELLRKDLQMQNSPRNARREKILLWGLIAAALVLGLLAVIGCVALVGWLFS